jgi:hypothetical protein
MMSSASRITASGVFLALLFYLLSRPGHSMSSVVITLPVSTIRRSILQRILAEQHQFVPALDQKLHYVGRWLPTSNHLRWDTAFPGAYLDLVVRNASIIYISLNNAPPTNKVEGADEKAPIRRMNLKTADDRKKAATPIALMVTVCNGDRIHFASSENGLIAIHLNARPGQNDCSVRISHAGGSLHEGGVFQFKGLWLPTGASLQPTASVEDKRVAGSATALDSYSELTAPYRKTVELLTDSLDPVFAGSAAYSSHWLSRVAAQFDADWVKISADDHCLTEACTKMLDISTQDIFFRSGPAGTAFFPRPWSFHQYVPEALILELGHVDHKFFLRSVAEYGKSRIEFRDTHQGLESFTNSFVSAYVTFIQQIRRAAYPLHPWTLDRYVLDGDGYTYNSAPSTLPIFVMRPPDGFLEQATLSVVEQMQQEGDKSVFWIDTSGWLSDVDYSSENTSQQVRALTAAGNAKVASFMGAHLCHYLAPQPDDCPFLRRDNYMGSVYVPIEAELDKVIEESKIKKVTELFWGNI